MDKGVLKDMIKTLKEYLREQRDPDLDYTEKKAKGAVDKVIVELKGNQSGKFTKLIKEYSSLKVQIDALEVKRVDLNAKIKDETESLFDAEDEVYTRVVETVSATLNLSKKTVVTSTKTDYEKVIEQLLEMVPDLTDKIQELIEANTKITSSTRSPSLRVDLNEGVFDWIKGLYAKIKTWAKGYDSDLKSLNKLISQL